MDSLRKKINLDEVPHFTTIQKFCQRIWSSTFTRLLNRIMNCSMTGERRSPAPLSIHSGTPALTPVTTTPGELVKRENGSENFDLGWYWSTDHHRPDNLPTSGPWYSSCRKTPKAMSQSQTFWSLWMDKGYDSEEIHELIRNTLNSCSLIPVRNRKRKRISGYYRRRIAQSFNQEKYHQRNKVETVFSVLKRKFGESL
jgi:hypothetical protein